MIKDNLQDKIDLVSKQVQDILIPVETLSIEESRGIIKRWVAAIEGNFQSWLSSALISARSDTGRLIAQENLWVEIQEDHASMLRKFAISANAEPNIEDFRAVFKAVERVRGLIAEMSGVKNVALMAIFENNRAVYPYLAELARKTTSNDFVYTSVHEVEDIGHAIEFHKALSAEVKSDCNSEYKVEEVITVLMILYHAIFEPKSYCN